MSDNSPRARRLRHAKAALEIVEDRLRRIEVDAQEVKDFHTLQVAGRIRDAAHEAHELIEQVFADSIESTE